MKFDSLAPRGVLFLGLRALLIGAFDWRHDEADRDLIRRAEEDG